MLARLQANAGTRIHPESEAKIQPCSIGSKTRKLATELVLPKGRNCVRWQQMPGRTWLPEKERRPEDVEKGKADEIRSVLFGEEPVPLLLCGPPGTGKTCVALVLLDYYGGLYCDFEEWCEDVRDAEFGRLTNSMGQLVFRRTVWRAWREANIAVMDDIGLRGDVRDFQLQAFKRALDCREAKPVIVITNLGWQRIVKVFDERIVSRLGAGTRVEFVRDRRITDTGDGRIG
jgi:DNA replication protein DnaC